MPDDKNLRLPGGDKGVDQLLTELESKMTDERLRDEWDLARGSVTRGGSTAAKRSTSELWTAFWFSSAPRMAGAAASVLLIAGLGIFFLLRSNVGTFRAGPGSQTADGLPATLKLDRQNHRAELVEPAQRLIAQLNPDRGGNGAYQISFSGTNAGGAYKFDGVLIATNVGTRIVGVLLDGTLTVGNGPGKRIQQPFLP